MNAHFFDIEPLQRFVQKVGSKSTTIRRPREIACFSYDDEHKFHLDDSSLRYFYPPQLPVDLNRGFDTFNKLDDSGDEHLDALLDTIIASEKETESKCEADIVTWRGMMTKLMTSPFDNLNGFEMNATYYQGTIFIEENNEHKNAQKELQRHQKMPPGAPSQDMMAFWGYKFETLALLSRPWDESSREAIESREEEVVNNKAQYCSVVRTGIGSTKIVIGGEVDAGDTPSQLLGIVRGLRADVLQRGSVWDTKPDRKEDPINWVELKTSAEIHNDRGMLKFERKLLKFWAQSFLLGVPTIIVGFRDESGILRRLEELATAEIPGRVKRQGRATWDGNICINFTASLLEWLRSIIKEEGMWRIRKREKSPAIEVFKLEESGHGGILSQPFLQWRSQN